MIDPAVLDWGGCTLKPDDDGEPMRWYAGEIRPGMVFAWEPGLPHARELIMVTRIASPPPPETVRHATGVAVINSSSDDAVVYTRSLAAERTRPMRGATLLRPDLPEGAEVWNEVSRFREAVVPTWIKDQP